MPLLSIFSIPHPFPTKKPRLRTPKRGRNFKLKNHVGEVLRPECALTYDALAAAYRECALEKIPQQLFCH